MKKFLSIILAVAMILSCTVAFAEETVANEATEEVVAIEEVAEETTEEEATEEVVEEVAEEETVTEEVKEEVAEEDTEETGEKAITVELDGKALVFDVQPLIINDRTMVPLRVIFEALGAVVNWDDETKTVSAFKEDTSVVLQIGTPTLFVGNEAKPMDVPAQIVSDRTLVPLRAVSEAFGCLVDWNGDEKKVTITTNTITEGEEIVLEGEATFVEGEVDENAEVAEEVIIDETITDETILDEVFIEEEIIEEVEEEIEEEFEEEATEEVVEE